MTTTLTVNKTNDGERNVTMFVNVRADDGDLPLTTLLDMSTLSQPNDLRYTKCRCDQIEFTVENGFEVDLYWEDALGNNAPLWQLTGRGRVPGWSYGSIQNTAVNKTGNVLISTQGWSASSGPLSASFIIEFVKQQ